MNAFLAELRRRNVFRVAAAYLVVGWLLIQITSLAIPALHLPDWTDTLVFFLLLIGFPVALLLAWAFEMTPDGMKLTAAVPEGQSITGKTARHLDYGVAAGLVLLMGVIVWQQMSGPRETSELMAASDVPISDIAEPVTSVAVLPFADMSEDGNQVYFADGISEEILNVLVRIPDLQVAGRTSSFAYRGQDQDLREIGSALDVSHILEGSVRRSGTRLRITAQLIRSEDGFHLWSETYDREVADIFDIQDEIAGAVSEQLAVSLGLDGDSIRVSRTDDIAAYEAYLQARQLYFTRGAENLDIALVLLNEAVARDPDYAPAWSALASVYSVYDAYQVDPTVEVRLRRRRAGTAAARRAILLDPRSGEAHARLGSFLLGARDLVAAMESLERALELSPNDAAVLDPVAQHFTEFGYFERSYELAQRAIEIDPLVAIYHSTAGWALSGMAGHDREAEIAHYRDGLALDPTFHYLWENLFIAYVDAGDREQAEAVLREQAVHFGENYPILQERLGLIRAWAEGSDALRAYAAGVSPGVGLEAGLALRDPDLALTLFRPVWDENRYSDISVFYFISLDVRAHPRWREQVRSDGLLELWQTYGFPPQCRPVGDDDFDCD